MKAQRHWYMVSGFLVKAWATVRARVVFYKAIVQAVLIYGSEIWVVTDSMMKVLEGFHNFISLIIMGKTSQHVRSEGWWWTPM